MALGLAAFNVGFAFVLCFYAAAFHAAKDYRNGQACFAIFLPILKWTAKHAVKQISRMCPNRDFAHGSGFFSELVVSVPSRVGERIAKHIFLGGGGWWYVI